MPELDLVIAISDAPAMAPYRDAVIAGLRQLAAHLIEEGVGLHVAVIGGDVREIGEYLVDLDVPWFLCSGDCRTRNYTGALADALVARAPVTAAGAPAPPLLAQIEHALDGNRGFLAPDGTLGVLIIGVEDDGSPGEVAGYRERLAARVPPERLQFAVVAGASSPRLDQLLPAAGDRGRASIDGDWSDAFRFGRLFKRPLALACLRDNLDPGECFATDRDGAELPACRMATPDQPDPSTPLPCFWIEQTPWCTSGLQATVERAKQVGWYDAKITCACRRGDL